MKSIRWAILLLFTLIGPVYAQSRSLVIILLPGTSLRDWQSANAPNLHRLMATGSLAVMNTRTARMPSDHARETPESAMLTLGAGARTAGNADDSIFLPANAPVPDFALTAGSLYQRRMGTPPPAGRLINLHWPSALRANVGRGYDIRLGNLTDTLAGVGITVRAGGGREASVVAASGAGSVLPTPAFFVHPSECLIWDAGISPAQADDLLGRVSEQVTQRHGRLIVISPFAGDLAFAQGRRLTPVLEWGADVPAGLLTSPSTHRIGLVTNTDFAPTVTAYFGRKTLAMRPFGQPWVAKPAPDAQNALQALEEQAYRQALGMQILPYLALAIALWMLLGTGMALRGRRPELWPLALPSLLLALLWSSTAAMTGGMFLLLLAAIWALRRRVDANTQLIALLSFFALSLVLDMVTGSRLMQRSLLGYSAVEGARYYGIGNEAMGALIGGLLVIATGLWRPARQVSVSLVVLLIVVALLLGSPLAGAKAGGLLVSLAAFGTLIYGLWGKRWSFRAILVLWSAVILAMALVALADAVLPGARHSHMGEAVQRIQAGGWREARDIAWRKLAVESRLAYHSAWACPLWIGLCCVIVVEKRSAATPKKRALQIAGWIAVGACLTLNDAGVIAAALCLVPLWSEALLRLVKDKPLEKHFSPGAEQQLG